MEFRTVIVRLSCSVYLPKLKIVSVPVLSLCEFLKTPEESPGT